MSYKNLKFLFCLALVVMVGSCNAFDKTAKVQDDTDLAKNLNGIQPAAGHLMMDYMPDTIPAVVPQEKPEDFLPQKISSPIWQQNRALGYDFDAAQTGRPKIVIVIDDLGLSKKKSKAIADLPGPITLAYLPYAKGLKKQTAYAKDRGHELLVHMPMQPTGLTADPGPHALKGGLSKRELLKRIEKNLSAFDGYVGINNHMGSGFTQDVAGLNILMSELRDRDVLYLDSRTSGKSQAETIARKHSVATTGRDVFIDHEITRPFIASALKKVEQVALRKGSAIAIGHPHHLTAEALAAWIPTLEAKGFDLVPITAVISERDSRLVGLNLR